MRRTTAAPWIKDLARHRIYIADPAGMAHDEWLKRSCRNAEKWTVTLRVAPDPVQPFDDRQRSYWRMLTGLIGPRQSSIGVVTTMAFRGFNDLITDEMWKRDALAQIPETPEIVEMMDDDVESTPAPRNSRNASRRQRREADGVERLAIGTGPVETEYVEHMAPEIRSKEAEDFAAVALDTRDRMAKGYEPERAADLNVAMLPRSFALAGLVFDGEMTPIDGTAVNRARYLGEQLRNASWDRIRQVIEREPLERIVLVARDVYPLFALQEVFGEPSSIPTLERKAMMCALPLFVLPDMDIRELCRAGRLVGQRLGLEPRIYD